MKIFILQQTSHSRKLIIGTLILKNISKYLKVLKNCNSLLNILLFDFYNKKLIN